MPAPTVKYQTKHDQPAQLLILAIEDGTNTIVLHPDALYWATYSTVKPSPSSRN